MSSDFGLLHLWQQGDAVSRATLLVLLVMSALSWIVILIKTLDAERMRRQAANTQAFWRSGSLEQALQRLRPRAVNPFLRLALDGHRAAMHYEAMPTMLPHDAPSKSEWISQALLDSMDATRDRLQSGLVVLSSVGSTAPFVGLFGTVWGIYHALMRISGVGQASIDQVAGPIGEALIMTAFGLLAAIPAVLGYNMLVRSNRAVLGRLRHFAHDLHAFYLTGTRMQDAAALGASTPPSSRPSRPARPENP